MKLTLPIITLGAVVASVFATPVHIPQDVYEPPITSLNACTVCTVNTTQTVTWDVFNPLTDITNLIGSIKLRKDGVTFYMLTLASGFEILLGEYEVTVAYVPESSKYIPVQINTQPLKLHTTMGDFGSWSPEFTITGGPSQCPV
ncbi:hypothetical protein EDD18DRAFT_1347694 [Armillaria luteobubalina]|uniref:Uncharacterized protein n=1 Tax=Armillaria luteobubalina TaxID=153913 RepID=A0AA39QEU1_9AGAR|nr:hypothetical protein EDD18DRAFT_1347694 [Armillaria luteobubalina]